MLFNFIKIIFLFLFFLRSFEVKSNILIFDVSHQKVSISGDSKKTNFTIYGFSDSPKNLVLKITGPNQKVVLQKKKKVFGMWTWNKTGEFSYPSLFHYYTNIKNNDIDFHVKKDLVDNIKLIGKDDDNLKKELIDKKMSIDLFSIKNESFELLSEGIPVFFKIPVKLPKNSPAGKYLVSMNLMDQGSKFETKKIEVFIEKPGVSSFVFEFAHKFSFLYGVFSAIIAIGLGITAGLIFKKN
ncbi:MAG: hypothetical protein CMP38_06720 [Rickettsiales bacterium]|nr:hypothetical protein [Rickettsiales bacterium]|tara:strand:- start:4073 stop:4792 length:720 start_codon:yes stop_codon:yes gene_type:complete